MIPPDSIPLVRQGRRGSELLAAVDASLPIVDLEFVWRGGANADVLSGEHRLLSRLLRRGPRGMSTRAFDEQVEGLGARLSSSVSREAVRITATVLSRNLRPLLAMVGRMLRDPAFRRKDLQLVRRQIEAELAANYDDDAALAYMAHRRLLYGAHPYAEPVGGTIGGLRRVSQQRIKELHAAEFHHGNLLVGASGDLEGASLPELLRAELGELPVRGRVRPALPAPRMERGRRVQIVHKPERAQTVLVMGALSRKTGDPRGASLVVADSAFGGMFTSRLTHEIRTLRGWSYSVSSDVVFARQKGAWRMSSHPAVGDLQACASRQLELYEDWLSAGLTLEEVERAKGYLLGSRAFDEDTAAKRMGIALEGQVLDRPRDAALRFRERVAAVSVQSANEAVRATLRPDDLAIVAVGDARLLEPVLQKLPGVVALDVVDAQDVLRAG